MKILFVVGGLGLGGAESQVILVSKELARLGHEVSIYALSSEAARIDKLAGTDVDVILDDKQQRLDLGVLRRLRRHIRSWRPDIVHGFKFDGDFYSRLAGWGARVPVLGSERTDNYEVSLVQRMGYRLTSLLCDGIVANTYGGAEFARRLHRVREDQVDVVWNGIDLQEAEARVAGSQQPARQIFPGADLKRLCMVASIKPQNDYPLGLRVLRRLVDRDPSWRLISVGDEALQFHGYKTQVLAERDRLQLEPYVEFVGHRRDVLELIASSDMLLMTSLHGGFPNVALEAMACGVPVLSTDYCDVRRVLPVAEQVVASRAELDIAEAVLHCYRHRAEVAKAQRRWFERHGTASASAATLLAVYAKYVYCGLSTGIAGL
jgi:glycosyltransferase involved in cell wall biosynthesis